MGREARDRPERLGEKLYQIRSDLGLTQAQMLDYLDIDYHVAYLSLWERDKTEPPLPVLLKYARRIGASADVLIDDDLDLPPIEPLPPAQRKRLKPQKPQKPQKHRRVVRRKM